MTNTHFRQLNDNRRLHCVDDDIYNGMKLLSATAPFVKEYLDKTYRVLSAALDEHPRLLAIRIDLRFPVTFNIKDDTRRSAIFQRFVDAFKEKVSSSQHRSQRAGARVHHTSVRYIWCQEYSQDGRPHYHAVIFLNRHAYRSLGHFRSESDNLYHRFVSSWASALGIAEETALGLVNFSKDGIFRIDKNDDKAFKECFRRLSYMSKVSSKRWGDGQRSFGSSREIW